MVQKTSQPHFDKVKEAIFNYYSSNKTVEMFELIQRTFNQPKESFRKSVSNRQKQLWSILDNCDIRTVGTMIDFCNERNLNLPTWIKTKKFTIEYNEKNMLDLNRIQEN